MIDRSHWWCLMLITAGVKVSLNIAGIFASDIYHQPALVALTSTPSRARPAQQLTRCHLATVNCPDQPLAANWHNDYTITITKRWVSTSTASARS